MRNGFGIEKRRIGEDGGGTRGLYGKRCVRRSHEGIGRKKLKGGIWGEVGM